MNLIITIVCSPQSVFQRTWTREEYHAVGFSATLVDLKHKCRDNVALMGQIDRYETEKNEDEDRIIVMRRTHGMDLDDPEELFKALCASMHGKPELAGHMRALLHSALSLSGRGRSGTQTVQKVVRAWDFIANIAQSIVAVDAPGDSFDDESYDSARLHVDVLAKHVIDFLEEACKQQDERGSGLHGGDEGVSRVEKGRHRTVAFESLRTKQHQLLWDSFVAWVVDEQGKDRADQLFSDMGETSIEALITDMTEEEAGVACQDEGIEFGHHTSKVAMHAVLAALWLQNMAKARAKGLVPTNSLSSPGAGRDLADQLTSDEYEQLVREMTPEEVHECCIEQCLPVTIDMSGNSAAMNSRGVGVEQARLLLMLHYGCLTEQEYNECAAKLLTLDEAVSKCADEGLTSKAALLSHYQAIMRGERPRRKRMIGKAPTKGSGARAWPSTSEVLNGISEVCWVKGSLQVLDDETAAALENELADPERPVAKHPHAVRDAVGLCTVSTWS